MKHPSSALCPEMAAGVRESVPAAAPYHAGRPAVALRGRTPAIRLHAQAGNTERLRFRSEDPVKTMRTSDAVERRDHLSHGCRRRKPSWTHELPQRQRPGCSSLIGSRGGCHPTEVTVLRSDAPGDAGDGCRGSSAERDSCRATCLREKPFGQACECATCSRGSTGLKRRRPTLSMLTPSTRSSWVAPSRRGEWMSPSW